jgi:hypothetical protein
LTKPEIYERVERRKELVSRAIDLLVESGVINRSGSGKRNDAYKFSALLSPTTTGDRKAETKTASNPAEFKEESYPRDFLKNQTTGDSFGTAFFEPKTGQKNGPESGLNGGIKDEEEERYVREERAGIEDDDGFEKVSR